MRDRGTRHLRWEGCFNARDLGGLAAAGGGRTRWGALVRADSLGALTAEGWDSLVAHDVRTIVDLRNDDERSADASPRPESLTTVRLPLDMSEDREFWGKWESGPQFATPLSFGPHLQRFPGRNAEVVAAIANAAPGGVVFHCVGGRDRSGQIAMILLALAGVSPDEIAADYALSDKRLRPLYESRGEEDQAPLLKAFLRQRGTTAEQVVVDTLESMDIEAQLLAGGLAQANLDTLRTRMRDG